MPELCRAGGGTIVNIDSGAALRPLEHRTANCAAGAGLVMSTKALAMRLAPDLIRVNAICPAIIDTPLFRRSFENAPDREAELSTIIGRCLIKRANVPEDIAAAMFLTSDEPSYITGSAMAVDGGRTFH